MDLKFYKKISWWRLILAVILTPVVGVIAACGIFLATVFIITGNLESVDYQGVFNFFEDYFIVGLIVTIPFMALVGFPLILALEIIKPKPMKAALIYIAVATFVPAFVFMFEESVRGAWFSAGVSGFVCGCFVAFTMLWRRKNVVVK